jgi:alpha-L-rhamnosidase
MADRVVISGMPIDPGDPRSRTTWQASWLTDPVFDHVAPRNLVNPNRNTENNGDIQNVHSLIRRSFALPDVTVCDARLYITADDCYKVYVNGTFVGLGPAPDYPDQCRYNAWDVTAMLVPEGQNVIAVHAFYHGMHSLTFPSGDNMQAVRFQLEVDLEDGRTRRIVSDGDCRCVRTDAYVSRHVIGYQTAFSEDIDLRRVPVGWTNVEFDDTEWKPPFVDVMATHFHTVPQQTPPLAVSKCQPDEIIRLGDGHYFVDFGSEMAACTVFRVSGSRGHQVEIRHGEELLEPNRVRYDMRCNCLYQEFCILSGREDETLEFFDYKGYRYVEVLNWPEELTLDRIWAYQRHYPFPEGASSFQSSNPLLNDIWSLCRNGGCQSGYTRYVSGLSDAREGRFHGGRFCDWDQSSRFDRGRPYSA